MTWDIRQTYYYLVCFATLLMSMFGAIQVVQSALNIVLPSDVYRPTPMEIYERMRPRTNAATDTTEAFSRDDLQRMADEESERFRTSQLRSDLRRLLGSVALIVIAAPVFLYHWKRVRDREKSSHFDHSHTNLPPL